MATTWAPTTRPERGAGNAPARVELADYVGVENRDERIQVAGLACRREALDDAAGGHGIDLEPWLGLAR